MYSNGSTLTWRQGLWVSLLCVWVGPLLLLLVLLFLLVLVLVLVLVLLLLLLLLLLLIIITHAHTHSLPLALPGTTLLYGKGRGQIVLHRTACTC